MSIMVADRQPQFQSGKPAHSGDDSTGDARMALSVKRPPRFASRQPRAAVAIDAWLLLPDDEVRPIEVRNISPDGFMGETPGEIPPGTTFGIVMPGCGIVRASVRWSEAGTIGGQFRRPLSLDRLERSLCSESASCGFLGARVRQKPLCGLRVDSEEGQA